MIYMYKALSSSVCAGCADLCIMHYGMCVVYVYSVYM